MIEPDLISYHATKADLVLDDYAANESYERELLRYLASAAHALTALAIAASTLSDDALLAKAEALGIDISPEAVRAAFAKERG